MTQGRVVLSLLVLSIFLPSCSKAHEPTTNRLEAKPQSSPVTMATSETTPVASATTQSGDLQPGQASGSYTAKGETVQLSYAYAGRATRFGNEATVILLTDKPIPADAIAEEIESQKLLLGEKIRGLEYAIDKDGYWVRYHPGQYQESRSHQLADFSIDKTTVRGSDNEQGDLTNGKYSRKVKFVATLIK